MKKGHNFLWEKEIGIGGNRLQKERFKIQKSYLRKDSKKNETAVGWVGRQVQARYLVSDQSAIATFLHSSFWYTHRRVCMILLPVVQSCLCVSSVTHFFGRTLVANRSFLYGSVGC